MVRYKRALSPQEGGVDTLLYLSRRLSDIFLVKYLEFEEKGGLKGLTPSLA